MYFIAPRRYAGGGLSDLGRLRSDRLRQISNRLRHLLMKRIPLCDGGSQPFNSGGVIRVALRERSAEAGKGAVHSLACAASGAFAEIGIVEGIIEAAIIE